MTASPVFAQVGALHDAKLDQQLEIEDPALAAKPAEGGWLAFSIPQLQTKRSPCCWKGKWGDRGETGCELNKTHQSYGTRDDSPIEDLVIVYNQINNGEVASTLVAGESCPGKRCSGWRRDTLNGQRLHYLSLCMTSTMKMHLKRRYLRYLSWVMIAVTKF